MGIESVSESVFLSTELVARARAIRTRVLTLPSEQLDKLTALKSYLGSDEMLSYCAQLGMTRFEETLIALETEAQASVPVETVLQKPALNDRVLITLQLPGRHGEQENVTMAALVTAVRADQPMLASLTVFPPMDSGLPPAGQLWAPFNASGNRKVGEWFWPT